MEVVKVPHAPDPSKPVRGSIFLAGPCPRDSGVLDWREQCCEMLKARGFDGHVFWPVPGDGDKFDSKNFDLDKQVSWETRFLRMADVIMFWVPRKIEASGPSPNLGLTTNVEFGLYAFAGKSVLGYPPEAERMRYLQWWQDKTWVSYGNDSTIPSSVDTLEKTVDRCLELLHGWGYRPTAAAAAAAAATDSASSAAAVPPALPRQDVTARYHGEQFIPLGLWRARCFQDWYTSQRAQGNELVWGNVEFQLQIPRKGHFNRTFFLAVLKAHVKIAAEGGRVKDNEVVVFRPDVASVIAYYVPKAAEHGGKQPTRNDVQVLLTKEFRTPVRNSVGQQIEPAAGSSWELVEHTVALPAPVAAAAADAASDEQSTKAAASASFTAEQLARADAVQRSKQLHEMAVEELHEETGQESISAERVKFVCSRQMAGTLSAHFGHVFAVRLTAAEFSAVKKAAAERTVFGVAEDTECTTLACESFGNILAGKGAGAGVDWSNVGMISQVIMGLSDEEIA